MHAPSPVAFAACPNYGSALAQALDGLIQQLGGWSAWVKPSTRVLVKPNLLADVAPERAVTTHPEFVRQVIRALKRAGAQVQVGDSPASAISLAQVWQATGIAAVCAAEDVPLLSFEQGGTRTVTRDGFSFAVATAALEADLIVSLPKVKSHTLTTLTAAVKNFYGVLPGYQKTRLHRAYPKPARFSAMLRALYATLPPTLSIADGVIGMEGEGPNNGEPVALGLLAASGNAVALDFALCALLGLDPRHVPFLEPEASSGQTAPFAWCGPAPARVAFQPPRSTLRSHLMHHMPAPWLKLVMPLVWVRPAFDVGCIACGRCVVACPVQALTLGDCVPEISGSRCRSPSTEGSAPVGQCVSGTNAASFFDPCAQLTHLPVLNRGRCIACCCCHEVCPTRAIHMCRSPLLRMMGIFRDLRT